MRYLTISLAALPSLAVGQAHATMRPTVQSSLETPVPPPPPEPLTIYDPTAGPFVVRLTRREEIDDDQYGVIANAVANWRGPPLQVFQICYQSDKDRREQPDLVALHKVADALKAQGAEAVVMPDGAYCALSSERSKWPSAYVLIMGVVRL
jgi:hypothetical protein